MAEDSKPTGSKPEVELYQFHRWEYGPNASSFCLKCVRAYDRRGVWLIDRLSSVGLLVQLETFVRLAKIPYTNKLGLNFGKKGKMPWIKVSKGRGGE